MSSSLPWDGAEAEGVPYTSSRQRSRSGSRHHSPQHSRYYTQEYEHDDGAAAEKDLLSPLGASSRKSRQRIDSMSSLGSSVAPAALPQHRSRRQGSSQRAASRGDGPTHKAHQPPPSIQLASFDSMRSGVSDWQEGTLPSIGEGGLEAWLRSQAVAEVPAAEAEGSHRTVGIAATTLNGSITHDLLPFRSFAPSGRVQRRFDSRAEAYEGMSDAARSVGAKSAGPRHDGTGSRRNHGKHRSAIPDWEASAVDADAAGIGVGQPSDRLAPNKANVARDWLDVDSQVASERRRTRRELSPGTLSASGVRLREGVRRVNRSSGAASRIGEGESSIDALLAGPARGTISASPSMGAIPSSSSFLSSSAQIPRRSSMVVQQQQNSQRLGSGTLARANSRDLVQGSPMRAWAKAMLIEKGASNATTNESAGVVAMVATVTSTVLISVLVKWAVGLGNWSGKSSGPLYGDFEAQRHWIEITTHLPPSQWYFYDLMYWGLDYPPLTAHVSRWCGKLASFFPALVPHFHLDSSRGSEAHELVIYMRATVLIFDLLVYVPAVLFFLSRRLHGRGRRTRVISILTVLLQPATILVDHGHFQYNTIMLGLAAASFSYLYTSLPNPDVDSTKAGGGGSGGASNMRERMKSLSRRVSYEYIAAAVFFSLSLCFKQMALYYAPAVFAIMLGRCVGLARIRFERGLICFTGIGFATIVSFTVVFRHWLNDLTQLGQIIYRIFPMARGLFEDKVSNVWCFLSVLPLPAKYKLKNALSVNALARLSLLCTLVAILLPCIHIFVAAAETVHIEMFLDEDSKRQVRASEKRQAEGSGSVVGGSSTAGRRPKYLANAPQAPSEVGSDLASILSGGAGARSNLSGIPGNSSSALHGQRASVPSCAVASSSPSPAASVLPYAMLSTSLAFFLFGFQTHEKSILLPLLPMTLLISIKADEWGAGAGKTDWEWAVLMNNIGTFSMWPLLQRDGLTLQYITLTVGWNWANGHRPFDGLTKHRKIFVAWFGAAVHVGMLVLHAVEVASTLIPSIMGPVLNRYPDLFAVFNVLLSTPVLVIVWLWSIKRQLEVGIACGVDIFRLQRSSPNNKNVRRKGTPVAAAAAAAGDRVERKSK